MASKTAKKGQVPKRFLKFQDAYPAIAKAHEQLGAAARSAGPLDSRMRALISLAIAVGARHEGAVHSHTRKALEAGCDAEEIRHAVLLSVTTIGFPNMMAALSWVNDVLDG
jgi:alkylhydroperoxidase/carboxymuconolactone decarboxylase family protein YurZ